MLKLPTCIFKLCVAELITVIRSFRSYVTVKTHIGLLEMFASNFYVAITILYFPVSVTRYHSISMHADILLHTVPDRC